MIKNRLTKLAKTIGDMTEHCRTCYGSPFAVIKVVYEPDPNGPGFRRTGECYLTDTRDRVTDDLCCVNCGRPVVTRISYMMLADEERDPAARRIAIPQGLS